MEEFWNDLEEGEIHFRDSLQFELKSEFFIHSNKQNTYTQEFYLFIPNSLQVNANTYTKEQFYLDETNLVRYKTPQISLRELTRTNNHNSPLIRLQHTSYKKPLKSKQIKRILNEIKLFGAIFKTDLRTQVHHLVLQLNERKAKISPYWQRRLTLLCTQIQQIRFTFSEIQKNFQQNLDEEEIQENFRYVDEFISHTIQQYLIIILKAIRDLKPKNSKKSDQYLCQIILQEQKYRQENNLLPDANKNKLNVDEAILYRYSLLSKFILEALSLKTNRFSIKEKHANLLGAIAAGIAMLIYMPLFIWHNTTLAINSVSFVLAVVIIYILKDRIKEGLKTFYYKEASKWFPDYSTQITRSANHRLGRLNENFSFLTSQQIPQKILQMREQDFHDEFPYLKRHETIIYYKREVILQEQLNRASRRRGLTMIFRLNIARFLQKADNPLQTYFSLEGIETKIKEQQVPKVYHINVIIRNASLKSHLKIKTELKKFRIIVDKIGIKSVEQIK